MSKENVFALFIALIVVVAVFVAAACTYVIDEREQAVITRLSRPIRVIVGNMDDEQFEQVKAEILAARQMDFADGAELPSELSISKGAGLYFRMPFIDAVERFDDVVLEYDAEPRDIVLADKKKLVVDNFARWRIVNPLLFRIRVRTNRSARDKLDDIIYSVMREELGRSPLVEVIRTTNRFVDKPSATELTEEEMAEDQEDNPMRERIEKGREVLMQAVTTRSDEKARQFGIRVLDVRIKRADLLQENLTAVFGRMMAERSRISKAYRSEGQRQAQIIEGTTDKEVEIILAEGKRDAEKLRGEGDAEAVGIFAAAFGSDPDLYRFMRSLDIIQEHTPEGSELIIGLDSGIYRLLHEE